MDASKIRRELNSMVHNRLDNYIIPGLCSELVGGTSEKTGLDRGKVRLFTQTREARDWITPHSHRFDFTALVLAGSVRNTLFCRPLPNAGQGDPWCESVIDQVCGVDGIREYTHKRNNFPTHYVQRHYQYDEGDTYSMTSDEIHSIVFEKGTVVLMFEGPPLTSTSLMLEPWVNGKCIPTFRTEPWMFEKQP